MRREGAWTRVDAESTREPSPGRRQRRGVRGARPGAGGAGRTWAGVEDDADDSGWGSSDPTAERRMGKMGARTGRAGAAETQRPLSATVGSRCRLDFHRGTPGRPWAWRSEERSGLRVVSMSIDGVEVAQRACRERGRPELSTERRSGLGPVKKRKLSRVPAGGRGKRGRPDGGVVSGAGAAPEVE